MTCIPDGCRKAEVMQIIKTWALKGAGTEVDPARILIQYWSFEGGLLAERDTIKEPTP